jgi:hypothetical protein
MTILASTTAIATREMLMFHVWPVVNATFCYVVPGISTQRQSREGEGRTIGKEGDIGLSQE